MKRFLILTVLMIAMLFSCTQVSENVDNNKELNNNQENNTGGNSDLPDDKPKTPITITLVGADGNELKKLEATSGEKVLLSVEVENLSHWNTKADGKGQSYNGTAVFDESVTLYAILLAENAHTIKYILDDGINNPQNSFSFTEDEFIVLKNPSKDGYKFLGWYDNKNFTGNAIKGWAAGDKTANVTLYAKWEKESESATEVTITFDINGADVTAPEAITATSGKSVKLPELTGVKFSHWNTKADGSGESYKGSATFGESVTLYAILLAENAHTIKYILDDGINNPQNPFSFTEEDYIGIKNPTKAGYTFLGWYDNEDFTGKPIKGWAAGDKTANVTLYAKWQKESDPATEVTITFDINGADITAPEAITSTSVESVKLPELTGVKFSHWNTKADGSGQSYNGTAIFTESVTLYAILLAENAYTITYELDGGVNNPQNSFSFTEDDFIGLKNPSKDGYKFLGWYDNKNFTGKPIKGWAAGDKTANVTLYAKWEKEPEPAVKVTITFNVNGAGGTVPATITTTSVETVDLPTLTNAKFSHWNTKADGSGQSYNGTAIFTESVTLYAILLSENAHTITYELDGGVNHPKNKYSFTEDEMVPLREPTKDGYKFLGWYETADFSGEAIEVWYEGERTANVTLYAKWRKEGEPEGNEKVVPGTIEPTPEEAKIVIAAREKLAPAADDAILFYYRPDGDYTDWDLFLWADGAYGVAVNFDGTVDVDGNKVAYIDFKNNAYVSADIKDILTENGKVNFIVRKGGDTWALKDPGPDQSWQLSWGRFFAVISGQKNVYAVEKNAKPQIAEAVMISQLEMKLTLSFKYAIEAKPSDNGFKVVANDGSVIDIENMKNWTYKGTDDERYLKNYNYASVFWVKLRDEFDLRKTWKISHDSFIPDDGKQIMLNGVFGLTAAETETEAVNETLGAIYTSAGTTFKVWAPLASDVNLLIYNDWEAAKADGEEHNFILTEEEAAAATTANGGERTQMTLDKTTGVWSATVAGDLKGKYYTYEINNVGNTNRIYDIYANAAAPDSVAGQIVDLATDTAAQPAGWETEYTNPFTGSYTDAVIYEMHVRDWAKAYGGDGKFIELANSAEFIAHLKDLGITHVQILPAFDYAQKNEDSDYNWGYNPYQYNVPEGRYVVGHETDGRNAVKDFRALILALHNAGIAVNMDVVYNHTNGTGTGSLFDMTVPYYYYRLTSGGAYSNGSGCGNETASNAAMFKKYIIDSLKHWMKDYHVNGFRFDLMGLHEIETMKEIYAELKEIDPAVMVYGEPWTGGTAAVKDGITADSKNRIDEMDGVGMFNDNIRNAIKGAEFGGFQHGFVQGVYEDRDGKDLAAEVIKGLKGSPDLTTEPGRSLNYVECHDSYTLFDKLAMFYLEIEERDSSDGNLLADLIAAGGLETVKAQNKMCAAIIFLAQGTPFINGGQEFMRTKNGDHNSYMSSDEVNAIDMSFVETNKDVYNVYKGLIALRKANPDAFGANKSATATKAAEGVIKYTAGDFVVYFNSAKVAFDIDTTGYTTLVDVTSGAVVESTTLPTVVGAKNFVILKK